VDEVNSFEVFRDTWDFLKMNILAAKICIFAVKRILGSIL